MSRNQREGKYMGKTRSITYLDGVRHLLGAKHGRCSGYWLHNALVYRGTPKQNIANGRWEHWQ